MLKWGVGKKKEEKKEKKRGYVYVRDDCATLI